MLTQGIESKRSQVRRQNSQSPSACTKGQPSQRSSSSSNTIARDLQRTAPWTLLYADYVMLVLEQKEDLERQTQAWSERLAQFELRLNVTKTEYMTNDDQP
ncbi:hypothetical protein Y032_0031g2337 [Ancylostoma ceylanicum]|uniref:Reverse transcriptase domain-containing protein n=1 Tax=Ancylostoma ceylanicum TaxID=53326 RepID=A0A016UQJ8_9BILA|nr:hypothetical protein Y032_0031g2337 [Ancylostoma ceylanicum]